MPTEVTISNNEGASRYEARRGEEVIGRLVYEQLPDRVIYTSAVVDPAQRGQGIAGRLVQTALDDADLIAGRTVVPRCPYVAQWIQDHPGYQELLDA
ncbi:N-acetyltransferase [Calidifontibacter sp. DB0510]|uniref:N-acetyltransferase n=1 Tax=Metallococcus carri TaxID=1656884 RepID=A0A967B4D1_9MICO|nr:GNAT family N-acetyltransferase [Metallococcus carri]NHN57313.1 N-acetyltransferase [Metallococcus carri]NOP38082.1 N-acetyltransferase [Calidifontibacter sp. DB2511S]